MSNRPTLSGPPKKEAAQGLVEFALVLPLLLVLIFGVIEFGRMLFLYSMALSASREAARYGSAAGDSGSSLYYQDCNGIRAAAERIGRLAGIQPADIEIDYDTGPNSATFGGCPEGGEGPANISLGNRVRVQVVARYQPILPLAGVSTFPITAFSARTIIKDVNIGGAGSLYQPPPTVNLSFENEADADKTEDAEPHEVRINVSLTNVTPYEVRVPFTLSGSAIEGTDYTTDPASHLIVIPAGSVGVDMVLTINPDLLDEPNEAVIITLGAPENAEPGPQTSLSMTIVDDDDPPNVSFATAAQAVPEGLGVAQVRMQLSRPSGRDINVPFSVLSGSTATSLADYTLGASALLIPAGASEGVFDLQIVTDDVYEDDETVIFEMGDPDNGYAVKTPPTVHILTITNDDPLPVVSFTIPVQAVPENTGSIEAIVQLIDPRTNAPAISSKDISVPFTHAGTAAWGSSLTTPGADYTLTPTPLVIASGSSSGVLTMNIIADADNTENDETIILTLGAPTNAALGSPSVHTATITSKNVRFTLESQAVTETAGGANVVVTAQLNMVNDQPVVVPFTLTGTASLNADYTVVSPSNGQLVIPTGSTTASLTLRVNDDTQDEFDETLLVVMDNPANAARSVPWTHTLTILDNDDAPHVSLASAAATLSEAGGSVSVAAQLDLASGKPITVPFGLAGTATLGPNADYTALPASFLVISPGSTTANLTLAVNNDTLDEYDETAVVTLGAPTNATLAAPPAFRVYTLTIQDDDNEPTIAFTASTQSMYENSGGSMVATVQLSNYSGKPITVPYTMTGTAIKWPAANYDYTYTPTASQVVIPPGSLNATIHIQPFDDGLIENEETVDITLGTPANAQLAAPPAFLTHIAKIEDNELLDCTKISTFANAGHVYLDPPTNSQVKFTVDLRNLTDLDWAISLISMSWSDKTNNIASITFGGSTIWSDPSPSLNSPFSTSTFAAGSDLTLAPQQTKTLVFQFSTGSNGKVWNSANLEVQLRNTRTTCSSYMPPYPR